jgi:hypothetical protein
MIRKNDSEFSFVDAALVLIEKEWKTHRLNKLLGLVDWRPFDRQFKKLYVHDTGRPAWDPVVLFRCLLLVEWNTLSDPKLREALQFRFDLRKFAGIALDQEVPDDTTFVVFRNRIQSIWPRLHEELTRQLQSAGFEVQEALAVDATLVEAHSKPKSESGGGGDRDASWRGFPVKKKEQCLARRIGTRGELSRQLSAWYGIEIERTRRLRDASRQRKLGTSHRGITELSSISVTRYWVGAATAMQDVHRDLSPQSCSALDRPPPNRGESELVLA